MELDEQSRTNVKVFGLYVSDSESNEMNIAANNARLKQVDDYQFFTVEYEPSRGDGMAGIWNTKVGRVCALMSHMKVWLTLLRYQTKN